MHRLPVNLIRFVLTVHA